MNFKEPSRVIKHDRENIQSYYLYSVVFFLAAVDTEANATSGQVNGDSVTASSPHSVDNTTSGTSGEPSTPDRSDGNNVSSHSYLSEGCCNGRKTVLCSNCYGCSYCCN